MYDIISTVQYAKYCLLVLVGEIQFVIERKRSHLWHKNKRLNLFFADERLFARVTYKRRTPFLYQECPINIYLKYFSLPSVKYLFLMETGTEQKQPSRLLTESNTKLCKL
jgi:hypothetical protein